MWEWLSSTHRDSADFQSGFWAIFGGSDCSNGFTEHEILKKVGERQDLSIFFFLQGAELWYCNYIFTILLYFVPHLCMFSTSGEVHVVTLRGQCSQKLKQDTITRQEEDVMRVVWRYFAQHPRGRNVFALLSLLRCKSWLWAEPHSGCAMPTQVMPGS